MTLSITEIRPEEMRVIRQDNWFLVQIRSINGNWITQKEYKQEKNAINDCCNWY